MRSIDDQHKGQTEDWGFMVDDLIIAHLGKSWTFLFGEDFAAAMMERERFVKAWEKALAEVPVKPTRKRWFGRKG